MPYVSSVNPRGEPAWFNLERSVGLNGYNEKEDVKLVQFMLTRIYRSSLPVNGVATTDTTNLILRFQRDMASRGVRVRLDGRVDCARPAPGGVQGTGSLSGSIYTIHLMNEVLKRKDRAAFDRIPQVVRLSRNPNPYPFSKGPPPVTPATGGF